MELLLDLFGEALLEVFGEIVSSVFSETFQPSKGAGLITLGLNDLAERGEFEPHPAQVALHGAGAGLAKWHGDDRTPWRDCKAALS